MPTFHYKAKKKTAETVEGRITAQNQEEAVELVSQMGFLPVSIKEESFAGQLAGRVTTGRVKTRELYVFSRQLANLIKAGIPILRALQIISEQLNNKYFQEVLWEIHSGIKDGRTFSSCLGSYPKIFSSLYVAMVATGEEGGNLREMLLRIADYLQVQDEMNSRLRTAMAYPAFMILVGIGTVAFMLTFVMPKMSELFGTLGQSLPLPTQIVLTVSSIFRKWWMVISLALLFAWIPFIRWKNSSSGRLAFSAIKMRLPLIKDFSLKADMARFARTLGLLLESGVSLLPAIRIATPILDNEVIKTELRRCLSELAGGSTLGESLKKIKYIPAVMINLISVGEESGALSGTLHDIADFYEQETGETLKTAMSLLEPLMILAVGLIIGFIVIAMLLPVFQMDIMAR